MLISNPLLAPNESFHPDFVARGLELLSGVYPVGPGQMWHGGCHARCGATKTHAVRAIADGTVVGFRMPSKRPTDAAALAGHALNYGGGWTDDGFVLLKHEKESGEGVPVVFYSLYMHLGQVGEKPPGNTKPKLFDGAPGAVKADGKTQVSRKDILGELGSIYGQQDTMHFEIFADDASFKKFFKQSKSGDGAMSLWGDVYFVLPEGTPYALDEPKPGQKVDTPHKTYQELLISLSYDQGARVLKAYRVTGEEIGDFTDAGAEYTLYKRAQQWFPKNTSAGYELLRFGRKIGPDALPADAPNWQHVPLGYGLNAWIDLNTPAIRKFSDADFPDWLWQPVEEDGKLFDTKDSKCDAPELIEIFDADRDGLLAPLELNHALSDPAIQKRTQSLVCLFPSEWDYAEGTIEKKLGWVQKYFENPAQRKKELAEKQKAWITRVTASTQPRLAGLEKDLVEAKAGKKRFEDRQAELKKQRDAADKAYKAAALDAQKKRIALKNPQKQKKTSADALTKAEEAAESSADNAEQAKTTLETKQRALKIETDCIAEAALAITQIEQQIASAKKTLERETNALAEADKVIAQATEELKRPPTDSTEAWERFKKHVLALKWWDALTGTCALGDSTVWHFHPLAFIEHYRKCHWLDESELRRIYPDAKQITGNNFPKIREWYRPYINKMFYKYGVTTPIRMSHFFGQGAVESGFLQSMQEKSMEGQVEGNKVLGKSINKKSAMSEATLGHWYGLVQDEADPWWRLEKYNSKNIKITGSYSWINGNCGDTDAQKFRGRGFKQLTARANYAHYWVYRGWLDSKDFDEGWHTDPQYKAKNVAGMKKRPAPIDDPERVGTDPYNCFDSGGWYMTFERPHVMSAIDSDVPNFAETVSAKDAERKISLKVTKAINGGDKGKDDRLLYTRDAKEVLL